MAIVVPIVSEWNPRGLQRAAADISAQQSALSRAGAAAQAATLPATAALAALGAGAMYATSKASELEQAQGALASVFGPATAQMEQAAKAAQQVGLSQATYSQQAAQLGAQLNALGISQGDLAPTTDKLIALGADLAATFGGTTSDAVAALGALMRGEADPAERLGISIKAADVSARLAAKGMDGLTGEALKQAEATTRLELLWEQTAAAQGAAGREQDTTAARTQRLKATVDNLAASFGEQLLPVMERAAGAGQAALEWLGNNQGAATALAATVAVLAGAVLVTAGAMKALEVARAIAAAYTVLTSGVVANTAATVANGAAWLARQAAAGVAFLAAGAAAIAASTAAWLANTAAAVANAVAIGLASAASVVARGAVVAWTAAQWALNVAMSANPIGLVIALIVALIAGVVLAYNRFAWFRDGVQAVWRGLQGAISAVVGWFTGTAGPAISATVTAVAGFFRNLQAGAAAAWQGIQSAIAAVTDWFSGAAAGVASAAAGLGNAMGNLRNMVANAWQGIQDAIAPVADWVADKVAWLQGAVNTVRSLASTVANVLGGAFTGGSSRAAAGASPTALAGVRSLSAGAILPTYAGAPAVVINISGALDPDAVARQVDGLLADYYGRAGVTARRVESYA